MKVTAEESARLEEAAQRQNITVSRLLAEAALGTDSAPSPVLNKVMPSELVALRRQHEQLVGYMETMGSMRASAAFVNDALHDLTEAVHDLSERLGT